MMQGAVDILKEIAEEDAGVVYIFRRWVTGVHDNEQMQVLVVRARRSLSADQLYARVSELEGEFENRAKQFLLVRCLPDVAVELDTYEAYCETVGRAFPDLPDLPSGECRCEVRHYTDWWVEGGAVEVKVKRSWGGADSPFEVCMTDRFASGPDARVHG